MRLPIASSSARSWDTSSSDPGNDASAVSSASRLSRSRWLVGSSRISRLAPELTRIASDRRRRSPPDRPSSGFSASSPENRKRPSSARVGPGLSPGSAAAQPRPRSGRPRPRSPRRAGTDSRSARCARSAAFRTRARAFRPASRSTSSCRSRWRRPAIRARPAPATARRRGAAACRPPTARRARVRSPRGRCARGRRTKMPAPLRRTGRARSDRSSEASWRVTGPAWPACRPGSG